MLLLQQPPAHINNLLHGIGSTQSSDPRRVLCSFMQRMPGAKHAMHIMHHYQWKFVFQPQSQNWLTIQSTVILFLIT